MMSTQPNRSHARLMECTELLTDEQTKTLFYICAAVSMGAYLDDETLDFCIDVSLRIAQSGIVPEPFSKPRPQAAPVN